MKLGRYFVTGEISGNPYSGSSLVPMLVGGLLLTFIGMIAAVLLS
jgi:hypothetical protein